MDPERQKITVNGKVIRQPARRWLALHKPMGVVTTAQDEEGRRTVFDLLPDHDGLTYVDRLDANTTGLLLLTTDGDAVFRLTHPRYRIPRRYTALVHGKPTGEIESLVRRRWSVDGRPVEAREVRVRVKAVALIMSNYFSFFVFCLADPLLRGSPPVLFWDSEGRTAGCLYLKCPEWRQGYAILGRSGHYRWR